MTPEITSIIAKSAATIVETLVIPKIQEFCVKVKRKYDEVMIPKPEHFQEYFVRSYKKYSSANLIAIRNSQKLLREIYVPLTLVNGLCGGSMNDESDAWLISEYPKKMMDQFKKIVIVDSAGMGKSTVSKIMFLDIIEKDCSRIPIFIELRRLSKTHHIVDEISNQLNGINNQFDHSLLLTFIEEGDFIFFIDGFDEISLDNRNEVISDIQSFIAKAHDNYFVLTSRPDESLTSFGDFRRFSIVPLKKKEAYELLRKYDGQGDISKLLIEKIKLPENTEINEFLVNPLLVSMLFAAFEYKQTIPLKKHLFYRQVYDALFNAHDLSKGDGFIHTKKSQLSIDDFERMLRSIGFDCVKLHQIEFDKNALLQLIKTAKERQCLDSFTESDFLDDLVSAVPLFHRDGVLFRWSHKSMAEYFAAMFICYDVKKEQSDLLNKIYVSDNIRNYENVLDIYYDLDIITFKNTIIYYFLLEYNDLYDPNMPEDEMKAKLLEGDCWIVIPSNGGLKFPEDINQVLKIFNNDDFSSWECIAYQIVNDVTCFRLDLKQTKKSIRLSIVLDLLKRKQFAMVKIIKNRKPNCECLQRDFVYKFTSNTYMQYDYNVQEVLLKLSSVRDYYIPYDVVSEGLQKLARERTQSNDSILSGI